MTTPTLPDDRIASMRSNLMRAVDEDVARRRHTTRRNLGLVAASVVVVGIGAATVAAVDNSSVSELSSTADSNGKSVAPNAGGAELDQRYDAGDSASTAEAERQVITTGSVSVTVKDPRLSASTLTSYVESLGGRVDNRNENGSGQDASASLQVRVPSTKVSALIETLKGYGNVHDVSLQHEDVTSVSQDLDARIDALNISVARLQDILAKASSSKEVISAESALTQRQEQLESLQSQRRGLAGQVELSSLSVDFSQKTSVESVKPGGFTGGLRDGWNALVSTLNHVVELVGILLPWVLVAGVVLAAARLITRRKHWN